MVDYRSSQLDNAFSALADPTRRAMLVALAKKECTVSELAKPFEMSLAAISKHLRVLEDACLVRKQREGRTFRCQINPAPFHDITELLSYFESFWGERLDALEAFLTKSEKQGSNKRRKK